MTEYETVRDQMQAGDVVAFGGKGGISDAIKLFCRAPVSHLGVVLRRTIEGGDSGRVFVEVIESTSLSGTIGVQVHRMSDRLFGYKGDVWWLPLSDAARAKLDEVAFFDFLFQQRGKGYDFRQVAGAGIDFADFLGFENDEDFTRFFCSELVAAALEVGGVVRDVNASEVTPIELCRWAIYDRAVQLAGEPTQISKFNSIPVRQ